MSDWAIEILCTVALRVAVLAALAILIITGHPVWMLIVTFGLVLPLDWWRL